MEHHYSHSAHVTAWHWLLNEQYTSALMLIEYVRAQADTIIATMGDVATGPGEAAVMAVLIVGDLGFVVGGEDRQR